MGGRPKPHQRRDFDHRLMLTKQPDRPSIASYVNIVREDAARRSVVQKVKAVERAVSNSWGKWMQGSRNDGRKIYSCRTTERLAASDRRHASDSDQ